MDSAMLDFEITQKCTQCGTPVRTRKLVAHISFPDDVTEIVEFLQGRLNVMPCPVCTSDVPILVPLLIQRQGTGQILAAAPGQVMSEIKRGLAGSDKSVTYDRCDNYNELMEKLIPCVNEEIVPGLQAVTNKTLFTKPRSERIALITPLLLGLLQAQVDDTL